METSRRAEIASFDKNNNNNNSHRSSHQLQPSISMLLLLQFPTLTMIQIHAEFRRGRHDSARHLSLHFHPLDPPHPMRG